MASETPPASCTTIMETLQESITPLTKAYVKDISGGCGASFSVIVVSGIFIFLKKLF